ncbi:hypothetical protein DID78_03065 [Candidatus Marinamargulisbacteria bacterium SCGC AG-343-D04]|nr:hypothetical protein DID78_03065 [Candidatus Marinamargulisbacteria bacterium SCGC AG-343-D04]
MFNNYELKPFDKRSKDANELFKDIDAVWKNSGGEGVVAEDMKQKLFHDKQFEKHPLLLTENDKAVGITWPEITTPYYGNITIHVPDDKHVEALIFHLKKKQYFKNKIMELVHIKQTSLYKECCFKHELISNIRQRMYLWLTNIPYFQEEKHPFEFRSLSEADIEWTSKISVDAHKISKDYQFYEEMINVDKRANLEKNVWGGMFGDVVQSGSIAVYYNQAPVGYCLVVNVKCWGHEKVPWIFDICIDPSFHGQGIGRALSSHFINNLMEEKYEIMGLAVTLTNKYALRMYEKFGFEFLDVFYEFMEL